MKDEKSVESRVDSEHSGHSVVSIVSSDEVIVEILGLVVDPVVRVEYSVVDSVVA